MPSRISEGQAKLSGQIAREQLAGLVAGVKMALKYALRPINEEIEKDNESLTVQQERKGRRCEQ